MERHYLLVSHPISLKKVLVEAEYNNQSLNRIKVHGIHVETHEGSWASSILTNKKPSQEQLTVKPKNGLLRLYTYEPLKPAEESKLTQSKEFRDAVLQKIRANKKKPGRPKN